MGEKFSFIIDVIGSCNLRCPSCPVGNFREVRTPSGLMAPELLDRILSKAVKDCELGSVALYNWTEPLLHPQLPELIEIVNAHGAQCLLSSNLNMLKDIDAVLLARPRELRISLSGFHQETYGLTHKGGQIERVKSNMAELAQARKRTRSKTKIHVAFHRYLRNQDDEAAMRAYADSLGFDFAPVWAYLMPLEKNLAYLGDSSTKATINDQDLALIDRLALHPHDATEVGKKHRQQPCVLRDRQMALDFDGNVMLCCAVYDRETYSLGPYLERSFEELQKAKYRHSLCAKCIRKGLHVVATYGAPELNDVAIQRIEQFNPAAQVAPLTICRIDKPHRRIGRLYVEVKKAVRNAVSKLSKSA